MKKIFRHWKIIYSACCLVYMGWIFQAGDIEFDRINSQYRSLVVQLDAERIRETALEELTAECLKKSGTGTKSGAGDCLSMPPAEVETRAKDIEKRFHRAQKRGFIKVVLFYTGFVIFFLLGPPLFLYLLLIGAIRIYRSIKIVR